MIECEIGRLFAAQFLVHLSQGLLVQRIDPLGGNKAQDGGEQGETGHDITQFQSNFGSLNGQGLVITNHMLRAVLVR